jgi:hypothetical protein
MSRAVVLHLGYSRPRVLTIATPGPESLWLRYSTGQTSAKRAPAAGR